MLQDLLHAINPIDPLPNALPVVCWLFMRTCTHTKLAGHWPQIMISLPFTCHAHDSFTHLVCTHHAASLLAKFTQIVNLLYSWVYGCALVIIQLMRLHRCNCVSIYNSIKVVLRLCCGFVVYLYLVFVNEQNVIVLQFGMAPVPNTKSVTSLLDSRQKYVRIVSRSCSSSSESKLSPTTLTLLFSSSALPGVDSSMSARAHL